MPRRMQRTTDLSRLPCCLDLAFGIALKGAGVSLLWDRLLGLALLGAALFAIGALSFRRSFA
jgi:ABC-2 type transport system permease protein